jgi:hypothetical protein
MLNDPQRIEHPVASLTLRCYDRGNIVPAAIKSHVTRDAMILVDRCHCVPNALAIGVHLLGGVDEHSGSVITIICVNIRFGADRFFVTGDKIGPS